MLLVSAVDNGGAADFGVLVRMRVKGPAADLLTPDHILERIMFYVSTVDYKSFMLGTLFM